MSLGARFALATLVVLSITFSLMYWQLARRERERLVESKVLAGEMLTDLFARNIQAPIEFRDEDAIDAELHNLQSNSAIRSIFVWDDHAEPLARLGTAATPPRPEADSVRMVNGSARTARQIRSLSGDAIGAVVVDLSLDAEIEAYQRTRLDLMVGAAVLALGSSGLLIAIARRQVVAPLRRLVAAASAIGIGDLSARVARDQRDEIDDLAAAFNTMADSLEDRETRLEAATRNLQELFDHMRQAIVAIGPDGIVVSEASRQARQIFGADDLRGRSLKQLLYGERPAFDVDVRAFDEWLDFAFATPPELWEQADQFAPHEVALGPERLPVTLEFRPIVRHGEVLQIMLLATDVSRERGLELAAQTKEEEYSRRLTAMRRLLLDGSQAFVAFIETAQARLAHARELVTSCGSHLATSTIDALFREAHTVRSEARAFEMRALEAETEQLETVLDEHRAAARGDGLPLTESLRASLLEGLDGAIDALRRDRDLFAEASPIGHAVFQQVTVQKTELEALWAYAEPAGGTLRALVNRVRSRPLGESTSGLFSAIPGWADAEEKQVRLVVDQGNFLVDPALGRSLSSVLTHLARNAVAHGIETPMDRRSAGKPEVGRIRVSAEETPHGTRVTVEDDGRGLDVDALRAHDPSSSAEALIFRAGLSTRRDATTVAGRGVGLDAVRSELEKVGYAISVASECGQFTRFTVCPAVDMPSPIPST